MVQQHMHEFCNWSMPINVPRGERETANKEGVDGVVAFMAKS